MSKLWLKSGHLVLESGAVVLCPECPCPEDTGTGSTGTSPVTGTGSTGTDTGTGTTGTSGTSGTEATGTGSTGTTGTGSTTGTGTATGTGTGSVTGTDTGTGSTGTGSTGTTGTGTGVGLWYCMDEFTTVSGCSFPCAVQPASWLFSHGGFWFPSPQRLGPSSVCNQWVRAVVPFGILPCGVQPQGHSFSWSLGYYSFYNEFRLRLSGNSSQQDSYSSIWKIWTCPAEDWNCVGPNTLFLSIDPTPECFGGGFEEAITIYPD